MRIILIHGYKSSPAGEFFPWLHDELRKRGHDVVMPTLPNPEAPDAEEWTKTLVDAVGTVNDETIIVGHSLGGAAALRLLEAAEARSTPKGVILIATPWMIGQEQLRNFFMSELDFDVLAWRADTFTIIHAKDDTKIPLDHAQKYANVLKGKLVVTEEGGHFQGKEYPVILQEIQEVIDKELVFAPGMSLDDQYADLQKR